MTKLVLDDVVGGFDLSKINSNFAKIEQELQDKVMYRDNPTGEPNTFLQNVDMNGKRLYNVGAPQLATDAVRLGDLPSTPYVIGTGVGTNITFVPTATLAAINVQAAIEESDTENRALSYTAEKAVGSIAALKALLKTQHTRAFVTGYTTQGDGGGGHYWYDSTDTTSTDNGGTIIVASDGGRWKLVVGSFISIKQCGAIGDGVTDDTIPMTRALAVGKPIYLPPGTYKLGTNEVTNNTYIFGAGASSIVRPLTTSSNYPFHCDSGSASVVNNIHDLVFRDFVMYGYVESTGFEEHTHLLALNGVTNVLITGMTFKGWKGDGIYLGSSNTGGLERHNVNVLIKNNIFDGINNNNRQAISIIDGDGVTVVENKFLNCSRPGDPAYISPNAYDVMDPTKGPGMPGVIDCEPDDVSYGIIKNIKIANNTFKTVGGNTGAVSVLVKANNPTPYNIHITDNDFDGKYSTSYSADVVLHTYRALTATSPNNQVVIKGNKGKNGVKTIELFAIKDVIIDSNSFETYTRGGRLGYTTQATDQCVDIVVKDNRFHSCASSATAPVLWYVGFATGLKLYSNIIDDCGAGDANSFIYYYLNACTTDKVDYWNEEVRNPTARALGYIAAAGHTFTSANNRYRGNVIPAGLTSAFSTSDSDVASVSWTPVIEGSTTAGIGTYTTQYGKYYRFAGRIWFEAKIVYTAHTGTGNMLITLPVNILSSTQQLPLAFASETITYTASRFPTAMISSANQRINIYQYQSAGAIGAILLTSNTAGTIYLSGSYPIA